MRRNINPEQFGQLPMFMRARDIVAGYTPNPLDGGTFDDKAEESRYVLGYGEGSPQKVLSGTLSDSIRKHWVRHPVELYDPRDDPQAPAAVIRPYVKQGNHRVGTQYAHSPDRYVPVRHTSSIYVGEG